MVTALKDDFHEQVIGVVHFIGAAFGMFIYIDCDQTHVIGTTIHASILL